jgi:hypothetical protein
MRQNYLFANGNAAVFRRRRIRAGSAHFVTPLRFPKKDIDENARDDRENEGEIQRDARRQSRNKSAQRYQVRARTDGAVSMIGSPGILK